MALDPWLSGASFEKLWDVTKKKKEDGSLSPAFPIVTSSASWAIPVATRQTDRVRTVYVDRVVYVERDTSPMPSLARPLPPADGHRRAGAVFEGDA